LDQREEAIAAFARRNGPRVGVPNLLLAKLWQDDEFYLKVLAGRDNVLNAGSSHGKFEGLQPKAKTSDRS